MIELHGKTVLVTGGARGIGAAIARAVGAAGASVLLHYGRSEAAADAVRAAIGGDRCHLIQADLADPEAPAELWRSARDLAELDYLPDGAIHQKEGAARRLRYLAIRLTKTQGELFADGTQVRHFCVVTNRNDPEAGDAGDLLVWHRGKAGTIEHSHHVLTNELAAEALPSQAFGANAAWFRMNVICYNLISAFKRLALPEAYHKIRRKRLRFLVLNTLGRVVRHARERLLKCASAFARQALDLFRVRIHAALPP